MVRNIPQLADILIFIEPNCSTAGIAVQVGEDACLNKLLLCPLLAVFALQTAAHSAVPVWKLKKTSPVQGDVTVYTARTMTKVVSEKSSNYSMFRTQDKGFFTTFNPRTKTYHKEDFDNLGKAASLVTSLGKFGKAQKTWTKLKTKRQICGKRAEGYKSTTSAGEPVSEAWYFTDCPIQQSTFLTKFFDVPDIQLEVAEVTLFQGGRSTKALKTLSVEETSVPEAFFVFPKGYKYSPDRFGVIDGGMDNIQGFAKDFLNGPESSGSKSQGKTEK